jgi:hypothetical protein
MTFDGEDYAGGGVWEWNVSTVNPLPPDALAR